MIGDAKGSLSLLEYNDLQWKVLINFKNVLENQNITALRALESPQGQRLVAVGGSKGTLKIVDLENSNFSFELAGGHETK